jgi:hypothetical protein
MVLLSRCHLDIDPRWPVIVASPHARAHEDLPHDVVDASRTYRTGHRVARSMTMVATRVRAQRPLSRALRSRPARLLPQLTAGRPPCAAQPRARHATADRSSRLKEWRRPGRDRLGTRRFPLRSAGQWFRASWDRTMPAPQPSRPSGDQHVAWAPPMRHRPAPRRRPYDGHGRARSLSWSCYE